MREVNGGDGKGPGASLPRVAVLSVIDLKLHCGGCNASVRTGDVTVVEHLPGMLKALSSIPKTTKISKAVLSLIVEHRLG